MGFPTEKRKKIAGQRQKAGRRRCRSGLPPPMIWTLVDEAAGLEEFGEEGVEEGGGEGVGEDEAVFPAVGPPAGGLDPEGLPERAVFFVGEGGVEDFAEDAVDEGGVALDGWSGFGARASFDGRAAPDHREDRGIEAQIAHADGIQRVGEADHILPLQDAIEPGPVDLRPVGPDEKEPVEHVAEVNITGGEMKRRVPQQKQRIEVRAGQQDARGVDAAFHRIARRELLQQGLQAAVGRA